MTKRKININTIIDNLLNSDNSKCVYDERTEQVTEVGELMNDLRHGIWYFINESDVESYTYNNGIINGPYKKYEKDGSLLYEGFKLKSTWNNEGLWTYYNYENDEISETGHYQNNKRQGEWQIFHRGKKYSLIYRDNKPWEGTLAQNNSNPFYETDGEYFICNFFSGLKQGEEKWFYKDGELKQINFFKDGKHIGESISYYRNGSVLSKGHYNNNERDGELIGYFPSGAIKIKRYWKLGQPTGIWLEYDENGVVISKQDNNK